MLFRYRYDTETGLYYLQSRYYNPEWGRFINADAIAGQVGELLGHNIFAYCKNNPVNMSDTRGFRSIPLVSSSEIEGTVDPEQDDYSIKGWNEFLNVALNGVGTGNIDDLRWAAAVAAENAVVSSSLDCGVFNTRTDLYRAVGIREFQSIKASNAFLPGANSLEGRQFAFTLEEALNYSNTDKSKVAIFKVSIPTKYIDNFHFSKGIDPHIFKNGVLTVDGDLNKFFNSIIDNITHVY